MPRPSRTIEAPVNVDTLKRGPERDAQLISVGDIIHGFRVIEKQHVPERNMIAYQLVHEATGARHLHLECDDMENTFCTTFKTIPTNSKGIPHILEHLALCGSNSYPVRDPFFNMAKRSLATYMNAWTGPDFTSYLFSSQNVKDFYNLMSVYLDACYFPKLEYLDFLQEGIRVEMSTPGEDAADTMEAEEHAAEEDETIAVHPVDSATDAPVATKKKSKKPTGKATPKFKGVVFNEMKGALVRISIPEV
jgi:Zn-dependent M16 (insulinase) family peptidase